MIIPSYSNIDIIQGVIGYGNSTEGITDWRIENSRNGVFNILNSSSQTPRFTIIENGNVGIGTIPISSSSKLDVGGNINITGVYKKNNRDVINDTSNYVLSTSNLLVNRIVDEVRFGSNYTSRINTELNIKIDNTSNYVATTYNSLANRVSNSQWTNVSSGIYYTKANSAITSTPQPLLITNELGTVRTMVFTYTTETAGAGTGQTLYTINVPTNITCDILVVGGGGGGGGGNTQIAPAHTTGQVGSYGGNGHDNTTTQTYTSTQGNIGGKALANASASGGGGGGASRNGGDAILVAGISSQTTTTNYYKGGKGGDGMLNNITNTLTYYGGGGTAGANTNSGTDTNTQIAPLGGGGIGSLAPTTNGSNGTNGLGGGGGGGDWERTAGTTGGSGIVIMRYRKVANYKIGNFSGDFKIIATSTANNNTEYMRIAENGSSIYNATGSPLWSTVSDRRIKENIEKASYEKCYNNIQNLELYRFNYISELNNLNKDLKQLGYIAQEVNEIFPKSVSTQTLYNNNLSMSDLLSIDITQINYTLFGSVKRLIELLNDKIKRLENLENIINNNQNYLTSNIAIDSYIE